MRRLGLILLLTVLPGAAVAAGWRLPSLAGELSGEYRPAPDRLLHWRITLPGSDQQLKPGELAVTGEGVELKVAFDLDGESGLVRWRVIGGRIDLEMWLPALAAYAEAPELLDVNVRGFLNLRGEGEWQPDRITGRVVADLDGVRLEHTGLEVTLDGIEGRIGGSVEDLLARDIPFDLSVRTLTHPRFGARTLALRGKVTGFTAAEVAAARIEIAGGSVEADPFTVSLSPLGVAARVRLARVGLQDIVQLVPTALANVEGRVNGDVRMAWSAEEGFQIGEGNLRLDSTAPTTLTLAASPGFLTSQVPARFVFLPSWLGPVANWFAPVNPAHASLQAIELGRVPLQVDSLTVRLSPDGDARGRTASVSIRARPFGKGGAVEIVTFQINVAGPLSEVLKLGLERDFSVKLR